MDKVKIKNIETGAIKEVKKSLAGDYIGTGKFEIYKLEQKAEPKAEIKPRFQIKKEDE